MTPQLSPFARELPHSLEAEEYLLSCCFIDGAHTLGLALAAKLTPLAFYAAANMKIFAQIMDMHATGKPIDLSVLAEELKAAGKLNDIGGYPYLMQISSKIPTTAQAPYFVQKVRELYFLRRVIAGAAAVTETAYDAGQIEAVPRLVGRLSEICADTADTDEPAWPQVVADALKRAELIIARDPEAMAGLLPWPWPVADKRFKPIAKGELVVIAARPSVGKSSLARALCLFAAVNRKEVLFGTLEDSPQSVANQAAAAASGVCYSEIANAHPKEQAEFLEAMRGLSMPNFHVFSRDNTMAAISSRARALHAKKPLDLVAIDQLSHVADSDPTGRENKASAVGRVTRGAKRMAVELQVPVLLMVQLNRESAKTGEEPKLHHLRDSGEIEQDADRVIFLHRPDTDPITGVNQAANEDADDLPTFYVNAIQAKGRSVGAGQLVSFYFKRKTASFTPAARVEPDKF